jgi:citrate lyase subunit beta/citryl-CoA lyase
VTGTLDPVAVARSVLFVPATRPERFDKALGSGAGLVAVDLEDAVPADDKEQARAAVVEWATSRSLADRLVVRVNAVGTPWHDDDVAALASIGPAGLVLPKAEPAAAAAVTSATDLPVIALVETAAGVLDARATAATPGVVRLALGSFDLAAELGIDPADAGALTLTRQTLVLVSAAADLPGPVDGVHAAIGADADAGLRQELEHARRLGFTGKLCIHPTQVAATEELLAPTTEDVAWARRVVAAAVDGVGVVDGKMVDPPVITRARRLMASVRTRGDA